MKAPCLMYYRKSLLSGLVVAGPGYRLLLTRCMGLVEGFSRSDKLLVPILWDIIPCPRVVGLSILSFSKRRVTVHVLK